MTLHDTHDARAVANEVLLYARSRGIKLTIMQLLKLVYLVQGWGLVLLERPIVSQDVQAWQYGPVYPHVYKAFVGRGSAPIEELAADRLTGVPYRANLDAQEQKILQTVVDSYGQMHAFQLSNIMHQPGTPWSEAYNRFGPYSAIPEDFIRDHFEKLKDERHVVVQ